MLIQWQSVLTQIGDERCLKKIYYFRYSFKARPAAYVICSIIPAGLIFLCIYLSFRQPDFIWVMLIPISILLGLIVWFGFFEVTLTNEKISYQTLFGKNKELYWKDIECASFESGRRDGNTPLFRLKLKKKPSVEGCDIEINTMVFSESDIRRLVKTIKGFSIDFC